MQTNIPWLPYVSDGWKIQKVKQCFFISKDISKKENPVVLTLARTGVRIRDISNNEGQMAASYDNYNAVVPGDLLLNPMDLYSGANCSLSEVSGVISPAYVNLRAKVPLNPKFFDYYFKTQYWMMAMFAHGKGVSFDNRWTINFDAVLNYEIPFPTLKKQDSIVEYVNQKCAEIDSLIAIEEVQINKLKDYRFSKTTELVSCGMCEGEMREALDSPWLPSIPKGWRFGKISYLADKSHPYPIGDGDHGMIKNGDYLSEGVPFIRVLNLTWGEGLSLDNLVYISEDKNALIKSSILKPNDLLVAKTGATIGKTAIIPEWMPISNTTSHVGKITFSPQADTKYYFYVFNSAIILKQIQNIASMQSTRPELGNEGLKNLLVPVPPLETQKKISTLLDNLYADINKAIEIKKTKIGLLQDYKKSLIFECVVGRRGC